MVFGFWAILLIAGMALLSSGADAIAYAESRNYTEPLFVFVVMVIAASRPVMHAVEASLRATARVFPAPTPIANAWLNFAVVPLFGSLITEPAAMTIAALMLAPQVFQQHISERSKYVALGVLFVNISIGGTLTAYATPPVLMVANTWGWDSAFMLTHFGWKAAAVVFVNATIATLVLRRELRASDLPDSSTFPSIPLPVILVHLGFLAAVVTFAHHPIIFLGPFLMFLAIIKVAVDGYR